MDIKNRMTNLVEKAPIKSDRIPQVSIGMPVYNGAKFIREALDSLLAQTYTDFELIISDNASTDGTEAICRDYAARDERVRYVRQPENRGGLANFQFVLDNSVGKYFMWAAADDVWESNWIQTLLPVTEKYQCLAYGMVVAIDEYGNRMQNMASGRVFNFYGNKVIRRAKYFYGQPSLGKANPIYGLSPRKNIAKSNISILGNVEDEADMVFLFDLLGEFEIRSPPKVTRLFKRIHAACAAPPNSGAVTSASLFDKIILLSVNSIVGPFRAVGTYRTYATHAESILLLLLAPVMAIRNLLVNFQNVVIRKLGKQTMTGS